MKGKGREAGVEGLKGKERQGWIDGGKTEGWLDDRWMQEGRFKENLDG